MRAEDAVSETLDRVLSLAKGAAPGAEAHVRVRSRREANTRFAVNGITSNGDVSEVETQITLAQGQKHATTTTNQTDEASLRAAVGRAVEMMRLSPPDPEWVGVLGPQDVKPNPAAWDGATAKLGAAARADAASACIAAAEKRGLTSAGFYMLRAEEIGVGTSAGLRLRHRQTRASLSTTARTADGTGSGWAGAESHRAGDLAGAELGRTATEKGVQSQKPRSLPPGRYTVVLEPAAVADLLGFLFQSLAARQADEGRSFFSKTGGGTRVGETLFPETISLRSDPFDPENPSAPFGEDGLPAEPVTWIDRGTLKALAYDRYWAQKQGKKPTSGRRTGHLAGGAAESVDALVAGTKRGILVTRFWYTRWVDPRSMVITGLTRDGVFLIEGGKIVAPVNNFRFNESPAVMLKNCEALTKATFRVPTSSGEYGANLRVPALRTAEFNMASVSEAV